MYQIVSKISKSIPLFYNKLKIGVLCIKRINQNLSSMTFQAYLDYFKDITQTLADQQQAPYDQAEYIDYTKLNWSRMNRWLKTAKLSDDLSGVIARITAPQHWIVITEPWCGDAAHSVPFIEMAGRENPLITVSYELRDSEPFRIEQYLTNNTKSIPKLVIHDDAGNDLATWGPRPAGCQQLQTQLVAEQADFERIKTEIQQWYNTDKGSEIQQELAETIATAWEKQDALG